MGLLSHEDSTAGMVARSFVMASPAIVAGITTIVLAQFVFPTQAAEAMWLMLLAWVGAGCALAVAKVAGRERRIVVEAPPADEHGPALLDVETGVGNARHLEEVLHREIARSARYGAPMALVVFEIEIASFRPSEPGQLPPSPAKFVAKTLVNAVRDSDTVHRLDKRRFVVVLTECDEKGAAVIISRVRTQMSTTPYARSENGVPIYARAWGAAVAWTPEYSTADSYLEAGFRALEHSRADYRAAAEFFEGGTESPQDAPGLGEAVEEPPSQERNVTVATSPALAHPHGGLNGAMKANR